MRGKSVLKEFQQFAVKGNVIDMAVGIIIWWAFGKVVSSLVSDIIMPPIGALLGGVDFTGIKVLLHWAIVNDTGAILKEAVYLNIGTFIQTAFDFIIVAFAMFVVIKMMNKFKKREQKKEEKKEVFTKDQQLLIQIRDALKKHKGSM